MFNIANRYRVDQIFLNYPKYRSINSLNLTNYINGPRLTRLQFLYYEVVLHSSVAMNVQLWPVVNVSTTFSIISKYFQNRFSRAAIIWTNWDWTRSRKSNIRLTRWRKMSIISYKKRKLMVKYWLLNYSIVLILLATINGKIHLKIGK